MAANLEQIVDDLSNLTVLEAAELSKMLEEKWGVSAAAPVAVAAAGGTGSSPPHVHDALRDTLYLLVQLRSRAAHARPRGGISVALFEQHVQRDLVADRPRLLKPSPLTLFCLARPRATAIAEEDRTAVARLDFGLPRHRAPRG